MSDILDSLGDVAGGVKDFLMPTTEARGGGWGFGDLLGTLKDTAANTALGGVSMLDDVLLDEGSSGRQKLFLGGLIGLGAVGGFMGARQLAAQSKIERDLVGGSLPALRRWGQAQGDLGLVPRTTVATEAGAAVLRQHPGIRPRTADLLGAADTVETARVLGSPLARTDVQRLTQIQTIVQAHADSLTDVAPQGAIGAAQLTFAKLDTAVDGKLIAAIKDVSKETGRRNSRFLELWRRFTDGELDAASPDGLEFLQMVSSFSQATNDIVEPDLSFDLAAKIDSVDFLPDGRIMLKAGLPSWSSDPQRVFFDAEERSRRVRGLNLRALAPRAKGIMKTLYDQGILDQKLRPEGYDGPIPGGLPRRMKRGSGWYRIAGEEIDAALAANADLTWRKYGPGTVDETTGEVIEGALLSERKIDKKILTAAVSLTSEAEEWEGNINLAVSVLQRSTDPRILDDDFQSWLRHNQYRDGAAGLDKHKYTGNRAAEHEAFFEQLHEVAKEGNQLDKATYKKVLRLANETPESVFLSTSGKKQKNFYLNLLDPDDPASITIDRHMHDVFLGLASSSDFKLLEGSSLSDSHYDVIADVLRELADELGVMPNEIQGVVWEAWKAKKEAYRSVAQAWGNRDPFRIKEPDGSENIVFLALQGEFGTNLSGALRGVDGRMIINDAATGSRGLSIVDDRLNVYGPADVTTAATFRHLRPALDMPGGSAMYGLSVPRKVRDVEATVAQLESKMSTHRTETWSADAWGPGGPPATWNVDSVVIDVPGKPITGLSKFGTVVTPTVRGSRTDTRSLERLDLADLDPDVFGDPERSPLATHQWVSIESAVSAPAGVRRVSVQEFLAARKAWEDRSAAEGTLREFGTSPLPPPEEYANHRVYLTERGDAGFAISPDGDLQQVFNGGRRGLGGDLVKYAISEGATTLDAYDAGLPDFYKRFGFIETERFKWNPEYDAQKRPEGPDIVYMALDPAAGVAMTQRGSLNTLVAQLRDAGYKPILQEGFYEGERNPSLLVFGMPVEEGLEWGRKFGQESIAAPSGIHYTDGTHRAADGLKFGVDPAAPDGGSTTTVRGRPVSWALTGIDGASESPSSVVSGRVTAPVQQVAVKMKDMSRLEDLVQKVERAGGKVSAVYSANPTVPQGWARVREHVYTDGVGVAVVRTADTELSSPHGYHVWVPKGAADGLPKKNPLGQRFVKDVQRVPLGRTSFVANDVVVSYPPGTTWASNAATTSADPSKLRSAEGKAPSHLVIDTTGPVPVVRVGWGKVKDGSVKIEGNRFVFDADPDDMSPAAQFLDIAGQLGIEPSRLRINAGAVTLDVANVEVPAERGKVTSVFAEEVPALKKTSSPLPEWMDNYGVWFDPAWRDGGSVVRLHDEFVGEFDNVMVRFMRDHDDMARFMGFHKIGVTPGLGVRKATKKKAASGEWYGGFFFGKTGSEIQLGAGWYGSPEQVRAWRLEQLNSNEFGVNLPPTAGAILAHELGHLVHEALIRSFFSKKQYNEWAKGALNKRFFKSLPPTKRAIAVSKYGASKFQEFMAETIAEAIFSDTPRALSRQVYAEVMEKFRSNQTYRKLDSWGREVS